jgi:hypothetical protein
MASKKQNQQQSDPYPPSIPVVTRRYRAYGECRELGIATIPHGYVLVEQYDDGTLRLADDQGAEEYVASVVPTSTAAASDITDTVDGAAPLDAAESAVSAPSATEVDKQHSAHSHRLEPVSARS